MVDDDQKTQIILDILESANPDKPWMTAKRIASKSDLAVEQTQELLLDHIAKSWEENGTPKIRYSNLPSKKTLQVLWGAVSQPKVGIRPLKPLARTDEIDDALNDVVDRASANIFFSHSHKDYDKVIRIAKSLAHAGFSPWLAETHIDLHEDINKEIEQAIGRAEAFLLFLSKHTLNSRWTGKEYGLALTAGDPDAVKRLKIPIFVIADDDTSICELVGQLTRSEKNRSDLPTELTGAAREFYESLEDHRYQAKYFKLINAELDSDELHLESIVEPFNEGFAQLREVLPRPKNPG